MTTRNYPWVRYWCPRTASVDLSVDGYLTDPESDYGRIANGEVLRFAQVAQTPCLVLLGEPGIGKTRTIRAEFDQGQQAAGDDAFDFVDLRAYGDERRLVDRLFDNESIRRWMAGTNRLHLLLDSLDECLLRIDTIAALLPEELSKLPLDRLSLRLTCRTAVWPALLETEVKRLWPQEDSLGIYELAPLRRADVEIAAQTNGIPAEDFCQAVDRAGAVPLAIKPVTLEMLLRESSTVGELTSDRWTLYERGCLQMAAELNERRLASGRKGKLTREQRLAVAGRVAVVTTIANRYAVWTSPDLANQPLEDVQLQELVGGTETAHGDQRRVGREELEEALDKGLFTGRGGGRLGWAHQTYAEFLAARHLFEHDVSLPQFLA